MTVPAGRQRPEDRLAAVADLVVRRGSVTVAALVDELGVSRMTVHRDLDELERRGVLRKLRGGATAERSTLFESSVEFRMRTATREKEALAGEAIGLVAPGQALLLDDSTTMLPLARRLPSVGPLTVATNFAAAQRLLGGERTIQLIGLGGDYHAHADAFHGLLCRQAIETLEADLAFLSVSAMHGRVALHQESEVVATKLAMLAAARRKVLLVDHGKFAGRALHRVGPVDLFDVVVVDEGIAPGDLAELREAGVDVRVAPV